MKIIHPEKEISVETIDIDDKNIKMAEKYWKKAQVDEIIKFHKEDSKIFLSRLIEKQTNFFFYDFVLIDCDKSSYSINYELSLGLLKPGGLLLLDNTLFKGLKFNDDPSVSSKFKTQIDSLSELNLKIAQDHRVSALVLPISDGFTICIKK